MQIVKWKELPGAANPHGVTVIKVLEYEHASIVIIELKKGETLKTHITPVDVFFYVLQGSGTCTIGDETTEIHQDEVIFSPKEIPHGLANPSSDNFRFLVVKTPAPKAPGKILSK